jgi:hypothetical protein
LRAHAITTFTICIINVLSGSMNWNPTKHEWCEELRKKVKEIMTDLIINIIFFHQWIKIWYDRWNIMSILNIRKRIKKHITYSIRLKSLLINKPVLIDILSIE